MSDGRDLALLVEAYMRLLRLSHHSMTRTRMQSVLASLVAEIAHISPGWSAEHVQRTCEDVVALIEGRDG